MSLGLTGGMVLLIFSRSGTINTPTPNPPPPFPQQRAIKVICSAHVTSIETTLDQSHMFTGMTLVYRKVQRYQ